MRLPCPQNDKRLLLPQENKISKYFASAQGHICRDACKISQRLLKDDWWLQNFSQFYCLNLPVGEFESSVALVFRVSGKSKTNNILNRSPGFIRFSEYNLEKKTMLIHSRIGCLTTVYNDNMINIACNGLFLLCPSSCSGSDSDNYSASSLCIGSNADLCICCSVVFLVSLSVSFLSGVSFGRVCSRSVYIVVGSWFIALLSCWLGGGGSFSGLTSSGLTILNVSKFPDIFWTSVFLNYVLFVTSFTCTIFFCFHIYIYFFDCHLVSRVLFLLLLHFRQQSILCRLMAGNWVALWTFFYRQVTPN